MNDTNGNSLTFQDLVVLKQFIEKGCRDNFFNTHEREPMKQIGQKISNIIQEVMSRDHEK